MSKLVYVFHNRETPFKVTSEISAQINIQLFDCWQALKCQTYKCPPDALLINENTIAPPELTNNNSFPVLYFATCDNAVTRLQAARNNTDGVVTGVKSLLQKIQYFRPSPKKLPHNASLLIASTNIERVSNISSYFGECDVVSRTTIADAMEEFINSQEEYSSQYHVSKSSTKRVDKYSLYDAIIVDKKIEGDFTPFDFLHAVRQTALSPHIPLILLADSLTPSERNAAISLDVVVLPRYVNNDNLKFAIICAIEKHTTSFNDYTTHHKSVNI